MTLQKQNICNAGEYYFASILSAQNFTVTITLGRAEKYDILAVNEKGKTIKISVKSRYKEAVKRFPLKESDETNGADDFFYVFVRLNEFKKEPDFWIVPSKRVNELTHHASHIYFDIKKRKDGKRHKDTGIRNFWLVINKTSKGLFPKNWENELKTYHKNISQLTR
ncbi:MAG: hypothetical protein NTZ73_01535 [Candidatus Diapherotrites archaeon]|nr:hypothetical protein [Candidatus Diapherotrites archaeon]